MKHPVLHGMALAAAVLLAPALSAQEATQACAACHALSQPDFATLGIRERLDRQAPPLWYAGNKYQEAWLVDWLQAPTVLHPAGYYPGNTAIIHTPEGDLPDPAQRTPHPVLSAAEASAAATELMALRPHDALIAAVDYTPGKVAQRMGSMDFRKFKGCQACHQDEEGEGGFSGPELYTAWQRLQPAYIVSFIADPRAWDHNTIMPQMEMNAAAVHKIADYLKLIGGEE